MTETVMEGSIAGLTIANHARTRILYFNHPDEDYLADGLLIGLLNTSSVEVYQYPVKNILYRGDTSGASIRGGGFTLYHTIEGDMPTTADPDQLSVADTFDLVIFSNIQRQYPYFRKYLPFLKGKQVWVIDGEDTPAMYPYHGGFWRVPSKWFYPAAHKYFPYFKREWTPDTIAYRYYKFPMRGLLKFFPAVRNLQTISFSIPNNKIVSATPRKTKLFTSHIVDAEVAGRVEHSSVNAVFADEQSYYADIQESRFGITTKRAGWDCLRHYEIAANGAVICFRDLDKKPETCAPHGLVAGENCISYSSFDDLQLKTQNLASEGYDALVANSLKWIRKQTCEYKARNMLNTYFEIK
jgi:hypothetical protein